MATYDYLRNSVKPPYDISDLLRWQWAQAVSALDRLIHDLVKIGAVQEYINRRPPTDKFWALVLPMKIHHSIELQSNNSHKILIFQQYISEKLSTESYQDPQKIADALSYIWNEPHKWQKIAVYMSESDETVKTTLKSIVLRRNQIVHAGDYVDFLSPKENIQRDDVYKVCDFIKKLGEAIYNLVK